MALNQRPDVGLVAASCHNEAELKQAAQLGVDFVVLGPLLPTPSHLDAVPLGWESAAKMIRDYSLPVYALGGMREQDLQAAWENGFTGIAMQRAVWE